MILRKFLIIVSLFKPLTNRSGNYWWLSFLLWLAMATAAGALELRVAIQDGVNQIKVGSSTKAIVRDGAGKAIGQLPAMNAIEARSNASGVNLSGWQAGEVWIEPSGDGFVWIGDRWYRGRTRLVMSKKGLTAVNLVDLEQYLYSVLGSEMSGDWPQEALKAQAVAARTYALYKRQQSRNGIYDLGNTTTWQVYKGVQTESQGTYAAVDATAGQVLTYNGKVILAVFHSSSGGHTENAEDIWAERLPYLRGVQDYDQGTPSFEWVKTFSRAQISQLLGVNNIVSLLAERKTPNGRILTMKVVGNNGTKRLSGDKLRDTLGLKSTFFIVNSTPTTFEIYGRGYGHGLGLSQWGAYNLAQQGANYQQILLHYYSNTTLAKVRY